MHVAARALTPATADNPAYTAMRQQDYTAALADLDRALDLWPTTRERC